MTLVITEDEIFKYLVQHEDVNMDVSENIRGFFSELPVNIFKNEYYILYRAFQFGYKYKMNISEAHLEQIVLSNMDDLLKDKNVDMYKDGETRYTENERSELIQQNVIGTYHMLEDLDIEDDVPYQGMRFNLKLYVKDWVTEEYAKTLVAQSNILREGVTYNGRMYKGVEDAHAHQQKKYELLRTLLDGDVGRLSDVIDTSVDSVADVKRKMEEEVFEIVAKTGIDPFDENYPLSKGEMLVIQGGSGAGKTRQAINIAHNGITEYKKNVLVLSLEQKASRIMPMFIAKHSTRYSESQSEWIADRDIIHQNLNEYQKIRKDLILDDLLSNDAYGKLRIEGVNLHANDVRSYLEKVWDDGFHFDIVVLDYIGIVETDGAERYNQLTEVVNGLKAECKTFKGEGFFAVLPNQLTNKAEESLAKGDYDMSGTGGSETAYLKRGADYVYTVNQTEEMKQTNKMEMILEKVRLGDPIAQKVNLIAFQGQCLYLSDEIEEDEDLALA